MRTWRSRARLGTAMVSVALFGLAGPPDALARAERTAPPAPVEEWPTTEFRVIHRPPPQLETMAQTQLALEWLSGVIKEPLSADEIALGQRLEDYLHDAAVKYQAAGFEAPALQTFRDPTDGLRVKYIAYLGGFDGESWVEYETYGFYDRAGQFLAINRHYPTMFKKNLEEDIYQTVAHELFHAIQATYRERFRAIPRYQKTMRHMTINEGMAVGAAVLLASARFSGYPENCEDLKCPGSYSYNDGFLTNDLPPDEPTSHADPYKTSSFWLHLAERFGSLSVLEYLMRHQPLPSDDPTSEQLLRWLDDGLRKHPGIKERLYSVYPHFVAELASYGGRRYPHVTQDKWQVWVVDGCFDFDMTLTPDIDVVSRRFDLAKMGAYCVKVNWNGFPEDAALKVEARHPDKAVVDQFHLGLVGSTYTDGSCWKYVSGNRRSSCVQEQIGAPTQAAEGWWAKSWQLPAAGYGAKGNGIFTLASVALDAWDTKGADGVKLLFSFARTEDHTGLQRAPSQGMHMRLPNPAGANPPSVDQAGAAVAEKPSYWHYRTYGINPDPPMQETVGYTLMPMAPIVIPKGAGPHAIDGPRYIVTPHPGKPVQIGATGPLWGVVLYDEPPDDAGPPSLKQGFALGSTGSLFCDGADKRPVGQVLVSTDDVLKVRVQTDICKVSLTGRRQVVDRLNVTVVLPFGWRNQEPAPKVEITPGVDYYVKRYFQRIEGRLEGDWPFGNPRPDMTPGTATETAGTATSGAPGNNSQSTVQVEPCDCSCAGYQAMDKRMEELKRQGDKAARAEANALMPCLKQCLMQWTACRK